MKTPTVGAPGLGRPNDPPKAAPGFEEALRAAGVGLGKPKPVAMDESGGQPAPPSGPHPPENDGGLG